MSYDQYGLQRGDHELKLGSMIDADFIKAETGKTKQQDASKGTQVAKVRLSKVTKSAEEVEASKLCLKR